MDSTTIAVADSTTDDRDVQHSPTRARKADTGRVERTAYSTSRTLDYLTETELIKQTGQEPYQWPLVLLKEPVDNAADACEQHGIAPAVSVVVNGRGITVSDNGPGIPPQVVESIPDFMRRVSSRAAYVSPMRGAQGNALKTIVAIPYVLSEGSRGEVTIAAQRVRHRIVVCVDHVNQEPRFVVERKDDGSVQIGTKLKIAWPQSACSLLESAKAQFVRLAENYAFFNPHLTIDVKWDKDVLVHCEPTAPNWDKWVASNPSCPHWHTPELLEKYFRAVVSHPGGADRPVRDVIEDFRGMKRNEKRARVLEAAKLPRRTKLSELLQPDGFDFNHVAVRRLLEAMQKENNEVKPAALGIIGEQHIRTRFEAAGCEMGEFRYKKVECPGPVPVLIEAAFAPHPAAFSDDAGGYSRRLITGINWSPAIDNPFQKLGDRSLEGVRQERMVGPYESVLIFLHVACPRVRYGDGGKSRAIVGAAEDGHAAAIIGAIEHVTKEWTKHKKALDRKQQQSRREFAKAMRRQKNAKVEIIDAAFAVMKDAYLEVSDNGTLPAKARQIYYKARGPILTATGEDRLDSNYFTQKLLPRYMREHESETAGWKVDYDPRGKLIEPHTKCVVPMGTQEVDRQLDVILKSFEQPNSVSFELPDIPIAYPTVGPHNRYGAILFCEKEGFNDLFAHVRLAERYDIALMSTKGMSVTAARHFIDRLQSICPAPVPVFVLHDLDKSGLSILATLQRTTERYKFTNRVPVIDLGVRIKDVRDENLESEDVVYKKSDPRFNLKQNGATDEEIALLCSEPYGKGWRGQRVEINAFSSRPLVNWVESKLMDNDVTKVVPDDATLRDAWKRAAGIKYLNDRLPVLLSDAEKEAETQSVPAGLRDKIWNYVARHPEAPWDVAIDAILRGHE